jgi:hypothetical protein
MQPESWKIKLETEPEWQLCMIISFKLGTITVNHPLEHPLLIFRFFMEIMLQLGFLSVKVFLT